MLYFLPENIEDFFFLQRLKTVTKITMSRRCSDREKLIEGRSRWCYQEMNKRIERKSVRQSLNGGLHIVRSLPNTVCMCVFFSTFKQPSIQNEFSDKHLDFCHRDPRRYEHVFLHPVSVTAEKEIYTTNTSVRNPQPSVQLNTHTRLFGQLNNTTIPVCGALRLHTIIQYREIIS